MRTDKKRLNAVRRQQAETRDVEIRMPPADSVEVLREDLDSLFAWADRLVAVLGDQGIDIEPPPFPSWDAARNTE